MIYLIVVVIFRDISAWGLQIKFAFIKNKIKDMS